MPFAFRGNNLGVCSSIPLGGSVVDSVNIPASDLSKIVEKGLVYFVIRRIEFSMGRPIVKVAIPFCFLLKGVEDGVRRS